MKTYLKSICGIAYCTMTYEAKNGERFNVIGVGDNNKQAVLDAITKLSFEVNF